VAHIKKEKKAEPMSDYIIYVILSPLNDKKFIVNKTGAKRLYKTYSEHFNLRVTKTKEMFREAREKSLLPPIYKLEEIHTSEQEVFRHCVAWTKYFIEHGYTQIADDSLGTYANDISNKTKKYYDNIKYEPIDEILLPSEGEYPDYGRLKSHGTNSNVMVYFSSEEYLQIKNTAEENGISMAAYCKSMSLNGRIVNADLSFIGDYINMFTEYKTMMRHMLFTINKTGKYYPADLKNIQDGIDKLIEIQSKVNEEAINLIRSLREQEK